MTAHAVRLVDLDHALVLLHGLLRVEAIAELLGIGLVDRRDRVERHPAEVVGFPQQNIG